MCLLLYPDPGTQSLKLFPRLPRHGTGRQGVTGEGQQSGPEQARHTPALPLTSRVILGQLLTRATF